jgi:L-alanine-DL-glutamate epimerase-like enolase superfamily enzyme
VTHTGLAQDVTAQPIAIVQGHVESLDHPGLGIDVDEDRVRRHRVPVATRNMA